MYWSRTASESLWTTSVPARSHSASPQSSRIRPVSWETRRIGTLRLELTEPLVTWALEWKVTSLLSFVRAGYERLLKVQLYRTGAGLCLLHARFFERPS